MNRNKAISLWGTIDAVIMIALIVAWISHAIGLTTFIACIIIVGAISTACLVHIVRRYPPENEQ